MTSLQLLGWISGSISLQLAVFLGIGFSRHWQRYQVLQSVADEPIPPESGLRPAAWGGFRTLRVIRRELEDAKGEICSFYLMPEDGQPLPTFLPGQYLTFKLDFASPEGGASPLVRCYSLSDAPQPGVYRVSVKRVPAPPGSDLPPGRSSSHFHDHVRVGSLLQARAPAGHFHLTSGEAPVVLIAGGIGITPMMSMLNTSLAAHPRRELWLFYGVRDGAELVMARHLNSLASKHTNFHLHICYSNPKSDDMTAPVLAAAVRHPERIGVAMLRSLLPLKPYHFYICGPTPMLQSLVPALDEWGVPQAHIHFEAFGPASIPRKRTAAPPNTAPEGAEALTVHFAKADRKLTWTLGSGNLLEFAEAHGIAVASGCRAGSCGTCQTAILAGEVAYSRSPDFDPEPGHCLLCVTVPKTTVTLEA